MCVTHLLLPMFLLAPDEKLMLKEDTTYPIAGSVVRATFKKGTIVSGGLKDGNLEVSRGTLAGNQSFAIKPNQNVELKDGTAATFAKGKVTGGVMTKETALLISGDVNTPYKFAAGAYTQFDANGDVWDGVLAEETSFFPSGVAGFKIAFRAKTRIQFNRKGEVESGYIAKKGGFRAAGAANPDVELPAGSQVNFNGKGELFSAVLSEATELATDKGSVKFKKGAYVRFDKGRAVAPKGG